MNRPKAKGTAAETDSLNGVLALIKPEMPRSVFEAPAGRATKELYAEDEHDWVYWRAECGVCGNQEAHCRTCSLTCCDVEEFIDTDGYPSMRVVKGERVGENEWAANIRREVLADLRAKVEGLRDEAVWARRGTVGENGLDTVPSAWHNGRTSLADAVLALIEEAGR